MRQYLLKFKPHIWSITLFVIIGIGFLVRIRQYAIGAALWVDEAALSLNIIHGTMSDLMHPLEYLQGAPIGFLWLTKLFVLLGNEGEYWLRLVPFLASLVVLSVFPFVARYYLSRNALLLAMVTLAFSERLIYYSAEVKQYSVDVLITIIGLAIFLFVRNKALTFGRTIFLVIAGPIMLLISHPSIFTLATIGVYLVYSTWIRGDRPKMLLVAVIGTVWLFSFFILLQLTLADLTQNERLLAFWSGGFSPPISTGVEWLQWHWQKLNELHVYPLGLASSGLAILVFIIGIVTYNRKDKELLYSLTMPIILLLISSWLGRYPFSDRMILFSAPLVSILVAQGAEEMMEKLGKIYRPFAIAVPFILLFSPILTTVDLIRNPQYKEELPSVLAYIRENWQEGDHIYLYHSAYLAFEYYRPRFAFHDSDYTVSVESRSDWLPYYRELDKLPDRNQRVWIVFTHVHQGSGANEESLFIRHLNYKGHDFVDSFFARNASTYLFDFNDEISRN